MGVDTGPEGYTPTGLRVAAVDGVLGVGCYLLAYRLRFPGSELAGFLPTALRTVPLVVACQIGALGAGEVYARRPRHRRIVTLPLSATLGTAVAAAAASLIGGFDGLSRFAFVAQLLLFTATAMTWRAVIAIWRQARVHPAEPFRGEMIDRSEEVVSVGANVFAMVRYKHLLRDLVVKELKLKYRGSVFGFLWSLMNPLLMMVVYTLAFTYVLRIRTEGFVFYLLLGILAWNFFASSATMSAGAVIDNAGLIKSVFFPRALLPIATVLFNFAQYLLTTIVFLPLMLVIYQVPLVSPMLLFPVFLLLQLAFTVGLGLILATATAFFRDVRHLLEVTLALMFWTTPILYELSMVPEPMQLPIRLSPASPFIVAYHTVFYYRVWPDPMTWLLPVAYAGGAVILGTWLFLSFQDRFAEQL